MCTASEDLTYCKLLSTFGKRQAVFKLLAEFGLRTQKDEQPSPQALAMLTSCQCSSQFWYSVDLLCIALVLGFVVQFVPFNGLGCVVTNGNTGIRGSLFAALTPHLPCQKPSVSVIL